jgi:hypothetical protein
LRSTIPGAATATPANILAAIEFIETAEIVAEESGLVHILATYDHAKAERFLLN